MQKEVVKTSLIAGEPGIDRFRPIAVKNQKNGVFFRQFLTKPYFVKGRRIGQVDEVILLVHI